MTATLPTTEVHYAPTGLGHYLKATRTVWWRELVLFTKSGPRLVIAFVQPMLFLFVLGTGLSSITGGALDEAGISYRTFAFPGIVATTVLMPSFFAAGSIVWDREFGFLREMLVAPVPRSAIVLGKCLGGATTAAGQGALVLTLCGLVDVPYDPVMLLGAIGMLILLSFALVCGGVAAAARITQFQSFMAVVQLIMFPLMFLSGTLFPLHGLPRWLEILTRLDPVTYAVDPLRRLILGSIDHVDDQTLQSLAPGITWGSWVVPTWLELGVVAGSAAILITLAIVQFQRAE
jgi:ABC-2 type transport system permease protein